MKKEVLIIGAGKIGRGFLAHLFYRSGYLVWFLDSSAEMVNRLRSEKRYRIDIAGATEDQVEYIGIAGAFTPDETNAVAALVSRIDIMASSVGAANLKGLAIFMQKILLTVGRTRTLNWIICENANDPASLIRSLLLREATLPLQQFVQNCLGLIETQVLRTGMEARREVAEKEPLALRMQDWWTLPLDADAIVGTLPEVEGFLPRHQFAFELTRKLYTFNGTNAAIAYLGWANGYQILHESARAFPHFFSQLQEESAHGLIGEFGLDEEEQRAFIAMAIKKYRDPALNDQVERNARDSMRKLARMERLVGPAMLCQKHGRVPEAFAIAIAAAYFYRGSADEGTCKVQELVSAHGIEAALKEVSGLEPEDELFARVVEAYAQRSFLQLQESQ